MLVQVTFLSSMPFFLASAANTLNAAPPAGEPKVLPSTSLIDLIELPALVISAKGARL